MARDASRQCSRLVDDFIVSKLEVVGVIVVGHVGDLRVENTTDNVSSGSSRSRTWEEVVEEEAEKDGGRGDEDMMYQISSIDLMLDV